MGLAKVAMHTLDGGDELQAIIHPIPLFYAFIVIAVVASLRHYGWHFVSPQTGAAGSGWNMAVR